MPREANAFRTPRSPRRSRSSPQLEAALRKTMSDCGVVQLLAEAGMEAVGSTSDGPDVPTRQRFAL
jgi:hypothetical protein